VTPRPIRFLGAARAELQQAVDVYEADQPGLGEELAEEVEHTVRLLQTHAELGSPYLAGTRRLLLRRFPFALVYRVREPDLVGVAVAHQRRRPGYWRPRR
jgi:plasmid stabilization system protein ParE